MPLLLRIPTHGSAHNAQYTGTRFAIRFSADVFGLARFLRAGLSLCHPVKSYMSLVRTAARPAPSARRAAHLLGTLAITALLSSGVTSCGSTTPTPPPPIDVGSIQLNTNAVQVEKGYHQQITATVRNKLGVTVSIPVVWRSLNEAVATVDANGRV
ncbi:MAG: hypothetical protein JWL61_2888, partial [Gemmatimonadetes bacterium]|nr:hypothetical protein [Gemmatimonadota bacterium]